MESYVCVCWGVLEPEHASESHALKGPLDLFTFKIEPLSASYQIEEDYERKGGFTGKENGN